MTLKRYYVTTGLMALILSPLAVSIGLIGVTLIVPPIITLALVWVLYARKAALPERASEVFLPILFAYSYYMLVWITVFGLSNYRFDSALFNNIYCKITIPYFVLNLFFSFGGDFSLFPLANVAITIITVLTIIITRVVSNKKIVFDKKVIIYGWYLFAYRASPLFNTMTAAQKSLLVIIGPSVFKMK